MKRNNIKPWLLIIAFCGLMGGALGISVNTSGVFYTPVANDLHLLRGSFALHMTIFNIVAGCAAFIVPRLMKKFPYKLILILSVVVAVLATIAMGMVSSLPLFYLLGAIRGLSTSMFSIVPLTMIINNWFVKAHGTATSVVLAASGIAGAIGSAAYGTLIQNTSWRVGYLAAGLTILVLALPAILIPFKNDPLDEGKLPYGASDDFKRQSAQKNEKKSFKFINVTFISILIVSVMMAFTTSMAQHFPGYAESIHFATAGALMLSAGMVGNIVFKVLIGIFSDKLGALKACLIMMVISALGLVVILIGGSSLTLILGGLLFGASYSVAAVGGPILVHYFFSDDLYDTIYPPVNFIANVGSAISLSAIGYIYDFFKSYQIAFFICIGMIAISFVFLLINKNRKEVN